MDDLQTLKRRNDARYVELRREDQYRQKERDKAKRAARKVKRQQREEA